MRALFPGRDEEGVKSGQFTDTTQFRQMGIGYCGRCGIGRLHGLRSCRRRGHRYGACCFRRGKGRMENNCSCGSSRCLLKVYVEDGVPLKVRTDEQDEDTIEVPQRRACPRGRAQISNITSPARIKHPMKRKGWSPENPNGEMCGKDEWERISWDEALDYIAAEMKKAYDAYGNRSILAAAYDDIGDTYFDPVICLLNSLGGAVHHDMGTVSLGSWPLPELFMTGGMLNAPDALAVAESDLHFHFGNNWLAN